PAARRADRMLAATASVLAAQSRTGSAVYGVSSRLSFTMPRESVTNDVGMSPGNAEGCLRALSLHTSQAAQCLEFSSHSVSTTYSSRTIRRGTPKCPTRHGGIGMETKNISARKGNILGTFDGNRSDV